MQVRRPGAKGQSQWRTGNRSRRVQRATNQEFKRLVRDEPALERESSSPTEQLHRKFKTSQKSCTEVRDARRAGEVQRHYPDPTESRDRRTRWRGGQDGREFYISHKAVVRENAESTKIRIVYDASARANASVLSLNECLEIDPPLQNQLWNVLILNRFYPVAIAGDLHQAFLQIRVRREDRDALRFHWIKDLASK